MSLRRLIVEADGGSRGNPGPAAYGALVRDAETGEVLAEVAEAIGVATNNVAEYRGVLAGLQAASAIDPEAVVEARLDSKLVVEQMSGRWKIKNPDLQPLALEAKRVLPAENVTFTWVPRAQNTHADQLVNQALDGKPIGVATVIKPEATAADAEPAGTASVVASWAPELATPTTLLLVRHGQTPMTAARRFSGGGVEGPSLDDTGRQQAQRAAELLAQSGAVAVVASPMRRTRETADAIAQRLGLAMRIDDSWRELEFGAWEGLTLAEITEKYPDEAARWLTSSDVRPPGGETIDEVVRRIAVARDKAVARNPGQPIIVVTHSMPVRSMVAMTLEAPARAVLRLQPAPGSVTEIQVYPDGATSVTGFGLRP